MFEARNGGLRDIAARGGVCVTHGCVLDHRDCKVRPIRLTGIMCRRGFSRV